VFTNGVFDLVHAGHVELLETARGLGGSLIVAINSDGSARTLDKGAGRPLVPAMDRARVIAALGCVDRVVIFDEPTPAELILALRPDLIVKGGDYAPDAVVGADLVPRWGGRVVIVPLMEGRSTTRILERARASS
jgi:rfaE bifunctional protein nucleotidyltransferase chain/domain